MAKRLKELIVGIAHGKVNWKETDLARAVTDKEHVFLIDEEGKVQVSDQGIHKTVDRVLSDHYQYAATHADGENLGQNPAHYAERAATIAFPNSTCWLARHDNVLFDPRNIEAWNAMRFLEGDKVGVFAHPVEYNTINASNAQRMVEDIVLQLMDPNYHEEKYGRRIITISTIGQVKEKGLDYDAVSAMMQKKTVYVVNTGNAHIMSGKHHHASSNYPDNFGLVVNARDKNKMDNWDVSKGSKIAIREELVRT